MAANAYVLLTVDPARTDEVARRLREIPGAIVREVLGPYDIVVEVQSDNTVEITWLVRNRIRAIQGVTSTVTCTWIEGPYGEQSGGE